MVELMIGLMAMSLTMWLAIATVDYVVSVMRGERRLRFSLRRMLVFAAIICFGLGAVVLSY